MKGEQEAAPATSLPRGGAAPRAKRLRAERGQGSAKSG